MCHLCAKLCQSHLVPQLAPLQPRLHRPLKLTIELLWQARPSMLDLHVQGEQLLRTCKPAHFQAGRDSMCGV